MKVRASADCGTCAPLGGRSSAEMKSVAGGTTGLVTVNLEAVRCGRGEYHADTLERHHALNQVSRLKLKWAYAFEGDVSAFAAPTVLGRTLFVGSAGGAVQALSIETGCVRWIYQASGPVRSAPVAVPNGKTHVLFTDLTGWVYGVKAETGRAANAHSRSKARSGVTVWAGSRL